MRFVLLLLPLLLVSCFEEKDTTQPSSAKSPDGFVRVNTTLQEFNEVQPWDRKSPFQRRGLGALLPNNQILTTSEMVTNHAYLELESADGSEKIPAKVIAVDRDANLALLAPEKVDEDSFISKLSPLELSSTLNIGDKIETWQIKNTGQTSVTKTNIHAVNIVPTYTAGKSFLSYLLKGTLQSASNSYTVPALSNGKLSGILTSYDSEEQISEVLSTEIIKQFLDDAADGDYQGFPSLGIAGANIPDETFRNWLGLTDEEGGLYLTRVAPGSAANEAGLEVGDVLLAFEGYDLDRKGYYNHPKYKKLSWTHLIRGSRKVGDIISLKIKRSGEILEKKATLKAAPKLLVPSEFANEGPQYVVKGGIIFQQLTKKYLQAHGKEWTNRAPLNLLDIYFQPGKYEERFDEIVIITGVIPSQNTVGYESIRNTLVTEVNGVEIKKLSDLKKGFSQPTDNMHDLTLSEAPYSIYLDASGCEEVDQALLQQGLPALQRILE